MDRGLWSPAGLIVAAVVFLLVVAPPTLSIGLRSQSVPVPIPVILAAVGTLPLLGAIRPRSAVVVPRSGLRRAFEALAVGVGICLILDRALGIGFPDLNTAPINAAVTASLVAGLTIALGRPALGGSGLLLVVFIIGMTPRDVYPTPTWSLMTSDQDLVVKSAVAASVGAVGLARYVLLRRPA